MMSDLAEIAAAAGITIIDEDDADEKVSVEAENLYGTKEQVSDELTAAEQIVQGQIHDWDVAFSDRYTMKDPGYAYTIEAGDVTQQQPCVVGFACFRQRDDRRNWDRNRRGGNRGRGGSSWNSGDSGSWNRQENSRYQPHNYGDHQHRGYGSQHNRSDSNERRSWGNSNDQDRAYGHHESREGREGYQNRGNVNYQGRQEQQNQHSRSNTGDRWNRNDVQGNKDSSRGGGRDRSTQR